MKTWMAGTSGHSFRQRAISKAELLAFASGWRKVAVDYQIVKKLDNFLKTFKALKGPQSKH
jgi:hypothetical protein